MSRQFPHRPKDAVPAEAKKPEPDARTVAREFAAGRSVVALTRKYGITALAVQALIREAARGGKK